MSNTSRWTVSFLIVLILHIGLAFSLLCLWNPTPPSLSTPTAAIMLELSAPIEASGHQIKTPSPVAQQVPQKIEKPEPTPTPMPIKELPKAPDPKVVIKTKKKPTKPKPTHKETAKTPLKPQETSQNTQSTAVVKTSASTTGANRSNRIVTPTAGIEQRSKQAQITWQNRLQTHLARYKRYPMQARRNHQQCLVAVRFSINSQGYVLNSQIIKTCGYPSLDHETIQVLKRAEPLPPPPPEILGNKSALTVTIPIDFTLKR